MLTRDEIERRFHEAASWLDREWADLLSSPPFDGLEVRDFSNRSGVDKGFPYFLWSKQLIHDTESGGEVWRAAIEIKYLEPIDPDPGSARDVQVRARAEVFQIGAESRLEETRVTTVELRGPLVDASRDAHRWSVERLDRWRAPASEGRDA